MKWISMTEQPHAHKPKITMRSAMRRLEWCKPLEQWKRVLDSDESHFTIWQSD